MAATRRAPSELETLAVRSVAAALGALQYDLVDDGGTDMAVDWMLTVSRSQRVALEVTRAADGALRAFWSKSGQHWTEQDGHPGYHLARVAAQSDRRRLRRELPKLLPFFPRLAHDDLQVVMWMQDHPLFEQAKQLSALGVHRTSYQPHPDGLSIVSLTTGSGGAVSAGTVADAAAAEIEPNRDKLRRTVADERHLFVAIDWSAGPAAAAAGFLPAPPDAPIDLGPHIDALWIAYPAEPAPDGRLDLLWQYHRRHGWRDHSPR